MIGHHEGEGENLLRLVVSGLKSGVCVCAPAAQVASITHTQWVTQTGAHLSQIAACNSSAVNYSSNIKAVSREFSYKRCYKITFINWKFFEIFTCNCPVILPFLSWMRSLLILARELHRAPCRKYVLKQHSHVHIYISGLICHCFLVAL